MEPKKTLSGERRVPKAYRPSLKFAEHHTVTIADRDYGLMRVTAASGTPHPRVITGVNLMTLKERLEEEQEKNMKAQLVESELDILTGIHFNTNANLSHRKLRLIDTPHPEKGTSLNPKRVQIESARASKIINPDKSRQSDAQPQQRSSTTRTLLPKKKGPILRKIKDKDGHTTSSSKSIIKKRVTLILPKLNVCPPSGAIRRSVEIISSSSSSTDSTTLLSFNERRRIFHEGEFTIAKNGRKMSDQMMPVSLKPLFLGDAIDHVVDGEAERAKAAIDMYIRSQGFVMAPTGTLTNLRRFSSQLSKRSVLSNPASIQSSQSSFESMNPKKKRAIVYATKNEKASIR